MFDLFFTDDIVVMQLAFYIALFLSFLTILMFFLDSSNKKIKYIVFGNLSYLLLHTVVLLSINGIIKLPVLVGMFDMLGVSFYIIVIYTLFNIQYSRFKLITYNVFHLILLSLLTFIFEQVSILRMVTNIFIVIMIFESIIVTKMQGGIIKTKTYINIILNIVLFITYKLSIVGYRIYTQNFEVGVDSISTSISVLTFIGVIFVIWINFTVMLINYDILNSQYKHLSFHDYLTKIPNRRSAMISLEKAILDCKNNKKVYGLLMFDIDGFKEYNDEFGHDFGDEVLVEFANNCKGLIRSNDMFSRYGGDEFLLLVELKNKEELDVFITRIKSHFVDMKLTKKKIKISFSIGKGYIDIDTNLNSSELVDQVDKSLYRQKNKKTL